MPDIVDTKTLTNGNTYKRAVDLLTKPTYGERHISPAGVDFIDPIYDVDIDLRKEVAISYIVYLDKNRFRKHITETELPNGGRIKTVTPELDLASVMAHSLTEQLYLLGEYYTLIYQLHRMNEQETNSFINIVKENRITIAAISYITLTAALCEAAYGKVPEKLNRILDRLGSNVTEAKSLAKNNLKMPHRYSISTLTRFLLEKMGEGRFRRSVATQMIKLLNPNLAKLVVRELIDRRRREYYLGDI